MQKIINNKRRWPAPRKDDSDSFGFLIKNIESLSRYALKYCSRPFFIDFKKFHLKLVREKKIVKSNKEYVFGALGVGELTRKYIDRHAIRLFSYMEQRESLPLPSEVVIKDPKKLASILDVISSVDYTNVSSHVGSSSVCLETLCRELDFLRTLILIIVKHCNRDKPVTFCKVCFRRAYPRKYCLKHWTKNDDFYLRSKKLLPYKERKEIRKLIEYREKLYNIDGERVVHDSSRISKLSGKKWADHFSKLLNPIPRVRKLVVSLCGSRQCDEKYDIAFALNNHFGSFKEFAKALYNFKGFENELEDQFSPSKVMTTLYLAEAYFAAEVEFRVGEDERYKDLEDRDALIMDYHNKGYSVRKISLELRKMGYVLGKSAVAKVINPIT